VATRSDQSDDGDEDFDIQQDAAPPPRPLRQGRPAGSSRPDRTTKWSVDRIDEREKRFSFIAAAGALVYGVVIYFTETQDAHFRLAKNQLTPQTALIIGLVAAALLFVTTLIGRRALVGFVALFTGFAFTNAYKYWIVALPFLAFAFWLLWRSYKVQRQASMDLREARAEAAKGRSSPASRASASSAKASTGTGSKAGSKGPARPQANKRYTPKAPPPPAQKLSRRERKAANAAD
jgi:hypothetical protein